MSERPIKASFGPTDTSSNALALLDDFAGDDTPLARGEGSFGQLYLLSLLNWNSANSSQ
jgi:hypothetical protein